MPEYIPIEEGGDGEITLTSASGTAVQTIFDFATVNTDIAALASTYTIKVKNLLESLMCTYALPSFAVAAVPEIYPESSESEKIVAQVAVWRQYQRTALDIHRAEGSGSWKRVARLILQNNGAERVAAIHQPYLTALGNVRLCKPNTKWGASIVIPSEFGTNGKILGSGDYVTLQFEWSRMGTMIPISEKTIANTQSFGVTVTSTPTLIRAARDGRQLLNLQNIGSEDCCIHPGNSSGLVFNQALKISGGGNGSFSYEKANLPLQWWAVCDTGKTTQLVGVEGW